eukprot:Gb_03660 [translate_table: standard]
MRKHKQLFKNFANALQVSFKKPNHLRKNLHSMLENISKMLIVCNCCCFQMDMSTPFTPQRQTQGMAPSLWQRSVNGTGGDMHTKYYKRGYILEASAPSISPKGMHRGLIGNFWELVGSTGLKRLKPLVIFSFSKLPALRQRCPLSLHTAQHTGRHCFMIWLINHCSYVAHIPKEISYEGHHSRALGHMSDDNPFVIPEMDPTLRTQIQQCNWQVVNVTTPANYFHVLRRQIHRDFRKPLVVMSPKNLLRHKDCKSNLSEFDDVQGHPGFDKQGTRFKRLIKDQSDHSDREEGIRRLILCSGKVYYELDEERQRVQGKDVAICRVEQLCPFPYDLVQRELKRYPNAEIVWCQEEPMNMGAYHYITPRILTAMKTIGRGNYEDIKYVGRAPSASTATGFYQVHVQEHRELVEKALQSDPIKFP